MDAVMTLLALHSTDHVAEVRERQARLSRVRWEDRRLGQDTAGTWVEDRRLEQQTAGTFSSSPGPSGGAGKSRITRTLVTSSNTCHHRLYSNIVMCW